MLLAGLQSASGAVACKSRNETKSHRGILVQDLLGAIHASFLKKEIEEHYMKFIPDTQCGCATGRGTCLAGQIVELAADSSKGFIVADSTYDMARMRSELKALSISDEVCEQIISEAATEKNLIRRAGTSSQLGDLIGDIHTATWIVCSNKMPSNDDSVLWTKHRLQPDVRTGAAQSQSCRGGERYLDTNRISPCAALVVCVTRGGGATRSDSSHWKDTVLADVTFVDDACFSLEADSPAALVCRSK